MQRMALRAAADADSVSFSLGFERKANLS